MPQTATPVAPEIVRTPNGADGHVLDRVAVRVRRRLAAERAPACDSGGGVHAASLIWPWPV
ncbi:MULTISPECIES: HaaA family cyclophane-containing RiPP peptide [Streptomycetaceae]|uniref:HaaA family cyclophane-containing RiPP peptide n=1 Tax=Streptomycetaceae TaxID=2062 RepID=UPI002AFE8076|nr:HaaA family cyclophane-containing RiPP peptide [Streptantibioticus cattleyicolor]